MHTLRWTDNPLSWEKERAHSCARAELSNPFRRSVACYCVQGVPREGLADPQEHGIDCFSFLSHSHLRAQAMYALEGFGILRKGRLLLAGNLLVISSVGTTIHSADFASLWSVLGKVFSTDTRTLISFFSRSHDLSRRCSVSSSLDFRTQVPPTHTLLLSHHRSTVHTTSAQVENSFNLE